MIIWKTIPLKKVILFAEDMYPAWKRAYLPKKVFIPNGIFQPSIFRHEGGQTPCLRCYLQCHHWNGAAFGAVKNGWRSETQEGTSGCIKKVWRSMTWWWYFLENFACSSFSGGSNSAIFRGEVSVFMWQGRNGKSHTWWFLFVAFGKCGEHVCIDLRTQQPSRVGWLIP